MAAIVKAITVPLPGWSDIWMALIASILTVVATAFINLLIPGTPFAVVFQAVFSLFITIVSMAIALGFVSGEIFLNAVMGPLLEILLNGLIMLLNFIFGTLLGGNILFGKTPFRPYVYQPVDLTNWANIFLNIMLQVTGISGTSSDLTLLGAGIVGAGAGATASTGDTGGSGTSNQVK